MSIQNSDMNVRAALPALLESQRSFLHPSVRAFVTVDEHTPASLYTDQVRVLQVLTNGLTNASKFTHSGALYLSCSLLDTSDIPSLRLPSNPGDKWVAFVVADTGKGLAGIDVDALFEPFKERVGNASKPEATHRLSENTLLRRARAALTYSSKKQRGAAASAAGTGASAVPPTYVTQVPTGDKGNRSPLFNSHYEIDSHPPLIGSSSEEEVGHSRAYSASTPLQKAISASSVARTRGSGLGLPVARLMARALGGDVDLYTQLIPASTDLPVPGSQLTVFLFVLPLAALSASKESTAGDHPPSFTQHALFGRSGLLNQQTRQMLRVRAFESLAQRLRPFSDKVNGLDGPASAIEQARHTLDSLHVHAVTVTSKSGNAAITDASISTAVPGLHEGDHVDVAAHGRQPPKDVRDSPSPSSEQIVSIEVRTPVPSSTPTHSAVRFQGLEAPTTTALGQNGVRTWSSGGEEAGANSSHNRVEHSEDSQPLALPSGSDGVPSRRSSACIRVLYAEDDGTNRRLMERMLARLGPQHGGNHGCAAQAHAHTTDRGAGNGQPSLSLPVCLVTAADGWEALCTLYEHGHIDFDTLKLAQMNSASSEGALPLPPVHEPGQRAKMPFDIILLDVDMPRATGDQVAHYIRQARANSTVPLRVQADVPVVAVTGRAIDLLMKGEEVGDDSRSCSSPEESPTFNSLISDSAMAAFDGALGKPFKLSHLVTLLDVSCLSGPTSRFQRAAPTVPGASTACSSEGSGKGHARAHKEGTAECACEDTALRRERMCADRG